MFLLTGNIAPTGASADTIQKRLDQYKKNIVYMIENSNCQKITFCENSNYKDFDGIDKIAKDNGKQFEYISFAGNQEKTQKLGRGYGDQEIIEYFVKNSKLLKDETSFYKITGRYKLLNINEVIESSKNQETAFMRMGPQDKRISTAFFKVNKEFFEKYLAGSGELVDDSKGEAYQLEGVYTSILKSQNTKSSATGISSFKILPLFSGITGSGYNLEDNKLRRILKKILFSLGFYNIK